MPVVAVPLDRIQVGDVEFGQPEFFAEGPGNVQWIRQCR